MTKLSKGIHKPKYSRSEVSQKFNLEELLGYMPSPEQKEYFHDLVVERIQHRTQKSKKDIDGKKFTKYSKEYAAYKGVSRSKVDLTLDDDMLQAFHPDNQGKGATVKIQVEDDEVDKSYNHNYGDTLPKRTYFGITNPDELDKIVKKVDKERIEKPKKEKASKIADAVAVETGEKATTAAYTYDQLMAGIDEFDLDGI